MSELDRRSAALQSTGKRAYQEDSFGLLDGRELGLDRGEQAVLLVADGMGGHVGGAMASDLLCKAFVEAYPQASGSIVERLQSGLEAGNKAIRAAVTEDFSLAGMGSTLVAAVVASDGLYWISVGDSPLWLLRAGQLERLNADHSEGAELDALVAEGRMTAEEAARDPRRNLLNSAVMGGHIEMIDVSGQPFDDLPTLSELELEPMALEQGDLVVLASDGLQTLSEPAIAAILAQTQDAPLADRVAALIQAVDEAGHPHQDNTTVLLYAPQCPDRS